MFIEHDFLIHFPLQVLRFLSKSTKVFSKITIKSIKITSESEGETISGLRQNLF